MIDHIYLPVTDIDRKVRRRLQQDQPARGTDLDQLLLHSGREDHDSERCLDATLSLLTDTCTLKTLGRSR
jgi:hypothetical protein